MNYWIFIATGHKVEGKVYTGEGTYRTRMEDGFWGIGERTPNRRNLKKADSVVFYLGAPEKTFAGTAVLKTDCYVLTDEQKESYGHGDAFYTSDYGVELEDIDQWPTPVAVEFLLSNLDFIENEEYWFPYFQGGVRRISEKDFRTIVGSRETTLVDRITRKKDIASESEFALEEHLEEFIFQNWGIINWRRDLVLYETDELNGRQYPAGPWSIDFLAVDRSNNGLVVVELKRGKTSDAVVGQVLRYINWVRENLAEPGQPVTGIIIGKEVDEALKYAVMGLDIEILTYKVDFGLNPSNG